MVGNCSFLIWISEWKPHAFICLLHHLLHDSKHQSTQVFERLLLILSFIGDSLKWFRKQLHNGTEYFMKSHLYVLSLNDFTCYTEIQMWLKMQFHKWSGLFVSFHASSRAEMTDESWMTPYWPLRSLQSGLCSLLYCWERLFWYANVLSYASLWEIQLSKANSHAIPVIYE